MTIGYNGAVLSNNKWKGNTIYRLREDAHRKRITYPNGNFKTKSNLLVNATTHWIAFWNPHSSGLVTQSVLFFEQYCVTVTQYCSKRRRDYVTNPDATLNNVYLRKLVGVRKCVWISRLMKKWCLSTTGKVCKLWPLLHLIVPCFREGI